MPFTAAELTNITNSALDHYMDRGKVHAQFIQNKPMLKAFDEAAGTFPGGKEFVSLAVKAGQGGLSLAGYTHDDQLSYGNPATTKRINFSWREHFIGMGLTHTELKHDGITVIENGGSQRTSEKDGREEQALANILENKIEDMAEDYAVSLDSLIHGDGSSDAKALAGIGAFILPDPDTGSTGGLSRVTNSWWQNRNRTAAGSTVITSSPTNGGALLQVLQAEQRQLDRYASNRKSRKFAGSDFLGALELELRANGNYTLNGWQSGAKADGAMPAISFAGITIEYDPTLDNLSLAKRMYDIDMNAIKLLYMSGEKMKKANPARPHDRFVMYQGMSTTAVMVCKRLNSSGVYDIS
jgi:hypothetical protein